ncbi:uncharacterized protein LOC142170388 [Nicotiana tabacum]|uniref:Uncharacterized protein LOC142170388 n=1 Tax=Nicotiana tabacum TaxID=4097 RepID=A0AC58STU2_TOBAC
MRDFLTIEDCEIWTIVNQGPLIPTKQNAQSETVPKDPSKFVAQSETVPKDPSKFVAADFRMMEKNENAKKILICGLDPDEYNKISMCSNVKKIWDALQTAHEGTNQVKRSRVELLMRNHELFSMKESERIQDMMTRFT